MRQIDRLTRLRDVSDLIADQALLPVKRARDIVQDLEQKVAQVSNHRKALLKAANDPAIAGTMLNQVERLRKKQMEITTELAKASAELSIARAASAKAVGRAHTLRTLVSPRNE